MEVAPTLARLGGHARIGHLAGLVGRPAVDQALRRGELVRVRRGHVALADLDDARRAAARLHGVVSHTSAALALGLPVLHQPRIPVVTVDRRRRIRPEQRAGVRLHWGSLDHADAGVTTLARTVVDCARVLPLVEALAVADSALRAGGDREEIRDLAAALPRTGRSRAQRVIGIASPLAANPFESALRALAVEAVGDLFRPQVRIAVADTLFRPDLACPELRIVLEADSHRFHTSREQITRDCHRYDELVLGGWTVYRFAWPQVVGEEEWCRSVIRRAVDRVRPTGRSRRHAA